MITLAEHTCATDCPGNPTFTPGISETSKWRSAQYKLGGRDIHFNIRSIASDTSSAFWWETSAQAWTDQVRLLVMALVEVAHSVLTC